MVMKRRKRKRSSKAANPPTPKISSDVENSASDSTVLPRADEQTHLGEEFGSGFYPERVENTSMNQ